MSIMKTLTQQSGFFLQLQEHTFLLSIDRSGATLDQQRLLPGSVVLLQENL